MTVGTQGSRTPWIFGSCPYEKRIEWKWMVRCLRIEVGLAIIGWIGQSIHCFYCIPTCRMSSVEEVAVNSILEIRRHRHSPHVFSWAHEVGGLNLMRTHHCCSLHHWEKLVACLSNVSFVYWQNPALNFLMGKRDLFLICRIYRLHPVKDLSFGYLNQTRTHCWC